MEDEIELFNEDQLDLVRVYNAIYNLDRLVMLAYKGGFIDKGNFKAYQLDIRRVIDKLNRRGDMDRCEKLIAYMEQMTEISLN